MTGIAQMPKEIKKWLNGRGINDGVIELFHITWDDTLKEIVIPVVDAQGNHLFNKYRKNPFDTTSDKPKYRYEKGSSIALFGIQFLAGATQVFICEGELDALVLHSRGWNAVSSTGGSSSFQSSWASLFNDKITYIIYDNDQPGFNGAYKTHLRVPNSKIIWLPNSVGDHGDITDFFKKNSLADFDILIDGAQKYDFVMVNEEEITSKKQRSAIIKDIKLRIKEAMDEAMALRNERKSDAHVQVFIEYLTNKYQEQNRALKFGSKTKNPKYKSGGFSSRIEQAKSVPINQYIDFNHQGFAKCLWHQEKTGSLFWYKNTNHVKCFGGCGMRYDVIDVVRKLQGVDLKGALEVLAPIKNEEKKC